MPFKQQEHECVRYLSLIPEDICPKNVLDSVRKIGRTILRYDDSEKLLVDSRLRGNDNADKGNDDVSQGNDNASDLLFPSRRESTPNKKYFVVSISSVWETKKYETNYFAELCAHILNKQEGISCVLTGGPGDKKDTDQFLEFMTTHHAHLLERIVNQVGKSSLFEFALFCKHAQFVVCNDSSPIHFASAFNTPTICFFGPTVLEFGFGPCSTKNLVIILENKL